MQTIQFKLFGTVVECWLQVDDGPRTSFDVAQLPEQTQAVIGDIIIAQQQELASKAATVAELQAQVTVLGDQVASLTEQLEALQNPE